LKLYIYCVEQKILLSCQILYSSLKIKKLLTSNFGTLPLASEIVIFAPCVRDTRFSSHSCFTGRDEVSINAAKPMECLIILLLPSFISLFFSKSVRSWMETYHAREPIVDKVRFCGIRVSYVNGECISICACRIEMCLN